MPEKNGEDKGKVDVTKTVVPIATVLLLAGGLIAFVWTAAEWKAAIQNNTKAIGQLTDAVEGTWTEKDMKRWISTLRLLNPNLVVPDAEK